MRTSSEKSTGGGYALVTGASNRIGKAIALELARMGFDIVLHYRSSIEQTDLVKSEVEAMGRKVKLLKFDFLGDNDYLEIFESLKHDGIEISVLVNSASDFKESGFMSSDALVLKEQLTINFQGAYSLTKAFTAVFKKGVIINLLDTKISKDNTIHLDYILSKKLLADFTRIAAIELAPDIRVNGICPGIILPPAGKGKDYIIDLAKDIPLKRHGSLEDIQRAVRFLVESSFVTGQFLYIDGGEHLSHS